MAGVSDRAASVLAKLRKRAAATDHSFQAMLQLFCQEELFRRLERSRYAGNMVLKGGMYLYIVSAFKSRPTVDIDFLLRSYSGEVEEVERMINEIIHVETENDFISFELANAHAIVANRVYEGAHVQLVGKIKNTRTPLSLDIGVGDVVIPEIGFRRVPTQLEGYASPSVLVYSLESTIAEKLHAMIQYKHMGSRMKDYHDVSYLAEVFDFEGDVLAEAVAETFRFRRSKLIRSDFEDVLALSGNRNMVLRWENMIMLKGVSQKSFDQVLKEIDSFMDPIVFAVGEGRPVPSHWDHVALRWD